MSISTTIRVLCVVLLPALMSGCSFALTHGPPVGHEQMEYFSCPESSVEPTLDFVWACVNGINAVNALSNPDENNIAGIVTAAELSWAVFSTAAALTGLERTRKCKDARRQLAARQARLRVAGRKPPAGDRVVQTVAAQPLPIRPGERIGIRSSSTPPGRLEVVYEGTSGDTLYGQALGSGTSLAIPMASITELERPFRGSNAGNGVIIGAVVGAFVEFIGLGAGTDDYFQPRFREVVRITALFTAIGAIPGALVGALIETDHWQEIPIDRARVSFVPQWGGRFAFGVRIAF